MDWFEVAALILLAAIWWKVDRIGARLNALRDKRSESK